MKKKRKTYGSYAEEEAEVGVILGGIEFDVLKLPYAPWEIVFDLITDDFEDIASVVVDLFSAQEKLADKASELDPKFLAQLVKRLGDAIKTVIFGHVGDVVTFSLAWMTSEYVGKPSRFRRGKTFEPYQPNLDRLPEGYEKTVEGLETFLAENCGQLEMVEALKAFFEVNNPVAVIEGYWGLIGMIADAIRQLKTASPQPTIDDEETETEPAEES